MRNRFEGMGFVSSKNETEKACYFTVAVSVNDNFATEDKEHTTFVPCFVYGKKLEDAKKHIEVGKEIAFSGRLKNQDKDKMIVLVDIFRTRDNSLGYTEKNNNTIATKPVEEINLNDITNFDGPVNTEVKKDNLDVPF